MTSSGLTGRLEQLAEKAQAATPGPWEKDAYYVVGQVPDGRPGGEVIVKCYPSVRGLTTEAQDRANAALIAAADPSVVAALVEVAQAAEADGDWVSPEVRAALARLADRLSTEGTKT